MGLFDNFKDFVSSAIPIGIAGITGGPGAAIGATGSVLNAKTPVRRFESATPMYQNDPGLTAGFSGVSAPANAANTGGFFSNLGTTIGDFGRGVGQFFTDIQPATSLFGLDTPRVSQPTPAARTVQRQLPEETAMSGEITGASIGLAPVIAGGARALARSPAGQALFGGGAGLAAGALMPSGNGAPRITRKMKADVRRIYMMSGMDPAATASILNNLGTYPRINFNTSLVFFILTKRFRNDGPVVTKAAVRKTKSTLRRMKGVVDMYNSVCKPTTRRAPARRAAPKAVQLIKN